MLSRKHIELARSALKTLHGAKGGIELICVVHNEAIFLTHIPPNLHFGKRRYKYAVVNRCVWDGATFVISHHSSDYLKENNIMYA